MIKENPRAGKARGFKTVNQQFLEAYFFWAVSMYPLVLSLI